ncbi:NKAP family protein CG6066 [Lucilia cuprina]|uniref:NKAP family protein CG6066 n=1 Tax=Lucilia cuprina TaxID=7375 RepID=UPI001F05D3D5|nr:NKAP family protein CG6066 [Lucilia cuprina]
MRSPTRSRSRHRSPEERRRGSMSRDRKEKDRRRRHSRSRSKSVHSKRSPNRKDGHRRHSRSISPSASKNRSYYGESSERKNSRRSRSKNRHRSTSSSSSDRSRSSHKKPVDRWPNDKYHENNNHKERANNPFRGQPSVLLPQEDRKRHGSGFRANNGRNDKYNKLDAKYLKQRREEREVIGIEGAADVWGKSPTHPEVYSDDEDDDDVKLLEHTYQGPKKKKSKKGKKKSSKKSKKKKTKKRNKSKNKKKKKESSSDDSSTEDSESSSSSSDSSDSDTSSSSDDDNEEVWVEKTADNLKKLSKTKKSKKMKKKQKKSKKSHESDDKYQAKSSSTKNTHNSQVQDEEDEFGPTLRQTGGLNQKDFGRALLPGEGAAMAAYIAEGKRIPRRGEIGLTSDEIATFESVGYVMSGSRHRRMEAVRIRKENQIYSADEKRALAMFSKEERQKRENKILSQFKDMINSKLHAKEKK